MAMDLVIAARHQGVLLYVEAGTLKAKAAQGAMTAELRETIAARKEELVALLAAVQPDWLGAKALAEQESWWRTALRDAPPVHALPLDHPRGAAPRMAVAAATSVATAQQRDALAALAGRYDCDIFHLLHAAFAMLLCRWSGQPHVVVGSRLPVALHGTRRRQAPCHHLVPVLADSGAGQSLDAVLAQARAGLDAAHAHGDLPVALVADLLGLERDGNHAPVMQLLFLQDDGTGATTALPPAFDLAALVQDMPDGSLGLAWTHDATVFPAPAVAALTRAYGTLLAALLRDPACPVDQLDIVSDTDWNRIADWNATAQPLPPYASLDAVFATHVAATPDAIAVEWDGGAITYAALDGQARRLAAHLATLGAGPGQVVAICVARGPDLMPAILATLMTGAAYLPLDPAYPQQRIGHILADSKAAVLLSHSALLDGLPACTVPVLCLDQDTAWRDGPALAAASGAGPGDLAYLIYTSGSTGTPKGVALEHGGALNLHANQVRHFGLTARSRVLQFASIGFDAATWEWLMALLNGATLVICPEAVRADGDALGAFLVDRRITHATLPPALLAHVDPTRDYALDALVVAGEACPDALRAAWAGQVPFFNAYGPSEATVCTTFERLHADGGVSIGRPLDNIQTYIVDQQSRLLPVGALGELLIGGVALARGYVGAPALTAERFPQLSLRPGHTQRLYRSGDLVRYLPGGRIDFVGRKDDMIKLRGLRIEPREIEAVLAAQDGVAQAVVLLRKTERGASLAAFAVAAPAPAEHAAYTAGLLSALAGQLPEYMVPATLLVLPALPMTTHGKVDQRALLALDSAPVGADDERARTGLEDTLATIWCELLKLDRVGLHDNFFAIGGDSILSIQAVTRANQAGIALTTRLLFDHSTIAGLAAVLEAGGGAAPAAAAAASAGEMPLLPIQARLFDLGDVAPHHYNQAVLLAAPAGLARATLEALSGALLARHDALRLAFPADADGTRRALFRPLAECDPGAVVHVETLGDALPFAAQIRARAEAHQAHFRLEQAPLWRIVYFDAGAQSRLLLVAHHLVIDAVSWRLLLRDLNLAHAQLAAGTAVALPPPVTSYQQWAEALVRHAGSEHLQAQLPYWIDQAARVTPALVPDGPRLGAFTRATSASATFELDPQRTAQLLRQCAVPYRTRINELLLTALAMAVRACRASDVLSVALEGHGREALFDQLDAGQTVGWFTSLFPLSLDCAAGDTGALIRSVKEQCRRIPDAGLGYGVLRYLGRNEVLAQAGAQQPQILFNYLGQFDTEAPGNAAFGFAAEETGASQADAQLREFALGINSVVSGGQLRCAIDYSVQEFDSATVEGLAAAYRAALCAVIDHCLHAEPVLTPADVPLAQVGAAALDALQRRYPLVRLYPATAMQRGLLFHTLIDTQAYTSQIALTLDGALQPALLRQAWQAVAARHDMFRTAIVDIDDTPHQLVVAHADLPWQEIDLSDLSGAAQEEAFTQGQLAQRRLGFDLRQPPLMRLALFRLAPQRYRMLWSHHHLLLDGWSLPIVYADVMAHYQALLAGSEPACTPVRPFEDYVGWLQGRDLAAARRYWRDYLAPMEAPTPLSVDRLPAALEGRPRVAEVTLSAQATEQLQALARRSRTTLYTVLQYAWGWLLHKYSGEQQVMFGAILSGRPAQLPGVEGMVGLFINTLPVTIRFDHDQPIEAALADLHRAFQESADFGYLALPEIRRESALAPGAALFDTLLVLENYPIEQALGGAATGPLQLSGVTAFEETNYKLTLNATLGQQLQVTCSYRSDMFGDSVVERLLGHFEAILLQLPQHEVPARIDMLGAAERRALLASAPAAAGGQRLCIHQRFERQARATPAAVALEYEGQAMSYAELDARAGALARVLRDGGAGPESLVGLCLERGPALLVGILGVLKAGAAYVPFDPATPPARLEYMLDDSAIAIVVTEQAACAALSATAARLELVDALMAAPWSPAEPLDVPGLGPASAAYVIYTSGSTGKPKGVLVEHGHVDRLMTVTEPQFGFDGSDVWTLFHSYAFDFSVWEMWGALFYGGRLLIVPKAVARSPEQFYRLVVSRAVTVLNQTPAAFEQFRRIDEQERAPLALRHVVFGGAALDYHTLGPWLAQHPAQPRLINMYGITETTVHVTFREILAADVTGAGASMIGLPLADLSAVVLDPAMQPVPIGVAGELYVGGGGVSRGYLNRPALTAERFLDDPAHPGARLYRTGDLVRRHESGELEYLGRIDNQVKIRGFRIELGEIESELKRLDTVREALVVVDGKGPAQRLVAYVVGAGDPAQQPALLRAALLRHLPDYMVPAVIMMVPAMPLNINGKIDRAALPAPQAAGTTVHGAAPMSEAEQRMAAIWQEVLGAAQVGAQDNFFALGGDSMRAIPLVARLRRAGFDVGIKELFETPTVGQLAGRHQAAAPAAAADLAPFALVEPAWLERLGYAPGDARLDDAYPMTALQQGMVFHNLLSADGGAYHDVMSFHVKAGWDQARFEAALATVSARHEVLRTVFDLSGEQPLQLVLASHRPALAVIDLRHLGHAEQQDAIAAAVETERTTRFAPAAPPWNVTIHLRAEGELQYTLNFHHALLDGWSVASLNTALFNAYLGKETPAAPAAPLPYKHYVQLELEAMRDPAVRGHWRDKLDGAELPWWAGKPKLHTRASVRRLDGAHSAALLALAQRLGVPERSVLLALHVALMALLDGRDDVLTSVVSNGRPEREGGDATLGLFLNSLPFRLQLGQDSWEQLILRVDAEVAAYYPVRRLPLPEIQAECGLDFSASLFNYVNFHVYQQLDDQLAVLGAQGAEEKNYAISLSFSKDSGGGAVQFDLSINVDADLFDAAALVRIEGYIDAIAQAMASASGAPVRLDRLPADVERTMLLQHWNETAAPYDALPVHLRFERQASVTPDAAAVRYGQAQASYAELARRSGQVAGALLALGAGSGQRIGLCVDNSLEMMAGMLAILKTGAAYVPLDPAHPRARTGQVVADADVTLLLTQSHLAGSLAACGATVLCLDDAGWYGDHAPLPAAPVDGAATAYVVYTSGSTGRPKGVVVSHRALAMYLAHAQASYYQPHLQGSLVATSFAFDLTKPALWLPLMTGGTLELLDAADPLGALARRLAGDGGGQLVRATPMHVQALLDLMPQAPCTARHAFVIGGEAFPPVLARELHQRFPHSAIYNHYGPSESVVGCAMYDVTANLDAPGATLPIGRPMSNTALYVLDAQLRPCALGVPGVLYVAGAGLADGYLGQPALTETVFVANPFANPFAGGALARMYRTGDLVRYRADGNLEFLGRVDQQVKLRGFRIELGEIEALVREQPGVREAVVVATGSGADMMLVAYLVPAPGTGDTDALGEQVRAALRARLPDYMVPGAVMCLAALPLSGNGKLDRRRLPVPTTGPQRAFVAPQGDTETALAALWSTILQAPAIGADDSFFELGGHSLKATRLVSSIAARFAVPLPLVSVFRFPVLREMAQQIDQQRAAQQIREHNEKSLAALSDLNEMDW